MHHMLECVADYLEDSALPRSEVIVHTAVMSFFLQLDAMECHPMNLERSHQSLNLLGIEQSIPVRIQRLGALVTLCSDFRDFADISLMLYLLADWAAEFRTRQTVSTC